jgi:hypothetical protein
MNRILDTLRELRWLSIFAAALAVVSVAYAIYMFVMGEEVYAIFGIGFAGVILAILSTDA